MDDTDRAREVLWAIGHERFEQPEIAKEALEIAVEEMKPGGDLIQVSWEIFMELLDDYGKLEEAFGSGIRYIPRGFLHSRVAACEADDLEQEAAITAWKSFRDFMAFTPEAWDAWLFMIAKNKLFSYLKKLYRIDRYVERNTYIDSETCYTFHGTMEYRQLRKVYRSEVVEIDRRGWSIPGICTDWIEFENEDAKAAFAAQILAMYQGQSEWIGPTGTRMQSLVRASSRSQLHKWWKEFIEEVHKRESKS